MIITTRGWYDKDVAVVFVDFDHLVLIYEDDVTNVIKLRTSDTPLDSFFKKKSQLKSGNLELFARKTACDDHGLILLIQAYMYSLNKDNVT